MGYKSTKDKRKEKSELMNEDFTGATETTCHNNGRTPALTCAAVSSIIIIMSLLLLCLCQRTQRRLDAAP